MKILMVLFLIATIVGKSFPQIHTETVEYKDGDVTLKGYLAYDESKKEKRPGVMVVHEWYGLNEYAKMRTEQLAKLGYVAFAADIYGNGMVAKNPGEAGKLAGEYRGDLVKFRRRLNAALDVLKQSNLVNGKNIAAIGYCFGGGGVLELARSGADIKGVVSFHGGLSTPNPDDAKNIKAKVLVLHGADDPHVSTEQIEAFKKEMNAAKVDWQMNYYSYAVHAFTNPNAGNDPSKGAAYNENADKRSWQAMLDFFNEIFK